MACPLGSLLASTWLPCHIPSRPYAGMFTLQGLQHVRELPGTERASCLRRMNLNTRFLCSQTTTLWSRCLCASPAATSR